MAKNSESNAVMKIALAAAIASLIAGAASAFGTSQIMKSEFATKTEAREIAESEDNKLIRYMDVRFDALSMELKIHSRMEHNFEGGR